MCGGFSVYFSAGPNYPGSYMGIYLEKKMHCALFIFYFYQERLTMHFIFSTLFLPQLT